jgi:hypothetical protein
MNQPQASLRLRTVIAINDILSSLFGIASAGGPPC